MRRGQDLAYYLFNIYTISTFLHNIYIIYTQEVYSVCLVTVGLLRWSDTFTTVLAVWVTLVTMASLPVTVRYAAVY